MTISLDGNAGISASGNILSASNIIANGNVTGNVVNANNLVVANAVTANLFVGNFQGNITGNLVVPGGNTQVLFNNNGNAGADINFRWDSGPDILYIGGSVDATGDISTTGNVVGNYILGNGSQLTGLPATYNDSNVTTLLASGNIATDIVTTANVTGTYLLGNGALLTGINSALQGNLVGNIDANTYYINNLPEMVVTGNITTSGGYVLGNAYYMTGLPNVGGGGNAYITNGSSNILIPTSGGNAQFIVGGVNSGNIAPFSVSIGANAGLTTQGNLSVAIGYQAGKVQGPNSVAIGANAALSQGQNAVAIGANIAITSQGTNAIAIGANAATNQSTAAIAIGAGAAYLNQTANAIAIGFQAANLTQGANTVAIGTQAGSNTQGSSAVAVGAGAGLTTQGASAVAVGVLAGNLTQGGSAVAVGVNAGGNAQGTAGIAIGSGAGRWNQSSQGIAIGTSAGVGTTGNTANAQGVQAIAIGLQSGQQAQSSQAIAIGAQAAQFYQGNRAVAIGQLAGNSTQSANAVAIGYQAGFSAQGGNSVAIGALAGATNQPANSIIINASGAAFNGTNAGLYVKPVRNDVGNLSYATYFNPSTNELTYAPAANAVIAGFSKYTSNVALTGLTANSVIILNTQEAQYGNTITYNTTTGNLTLLAGSTYRLRGYPGETGNTSVSGASIVTQWFNVTANTFVGSPGTAIAPTSAQLNGMSQGTAEYIYSAVVDTVFQYQVVTTVNTSTLGAGTPGTVTAGYPWIDVQVIAGFAPLTGLTNISALGNVSGANINTPGVVSAVGNVIGGNVIAINTVYGNSAQAFVAGPAAVNNVALQLNNNMAIRDVYAGGGSTMWFDVSTGSSSLLGQFQFRGSNAFTTYLTITSSGLSTNGVYLQTNNSAPVANTFVRANSVPSTSAAGTTCSLDNLNARLTVSTGTALYPQISAITGSFACYTTGTVNKSGSNLVAYTNSSGQTVTAGSWSNVGGFGTNYISSGGDITEFYVSDTTNTRTYRVVCGHGSGTTSGSITVERIA